MLFKTKSNTILKYTDCTYIRYKMERKACLHCTPGQQKYGKKIVIVIVIMITITLTNVIENDYLAF